LQRRCRRQIAFHLLSLGLDPIEEVGGRHAVLPAMVVGDALRDGGVQGVAGRRLRQLALELFGLEHEDLEGLGEHTRGIQAATDIAVQGFPVTLVEKESSLGGRLADPHLKFLYPTLSPVADVLDEKVERLYESGARVLLDTEVEAITGFVGNFNPNFILPGNLEDDFELETGTFGFDQLYLRWQRKESFSLAVGRLQTRFQLRGGVYAKSLDRNNSHNWRVNWTDGLQATLKTGDWRTSFVFQANPRSGPTGVRRYPLDFDDDGARLTYFLASENFERKGVLVQRAFDINYLPASLLKDGEPDGRRTDYWGLVGRLMCVWPPEKEGLRLRAGPEIGYAPETPTYEAQNLPGSGDVSGLAWNVVISAIDFAPAHSIGVNYGRTGAGWLLSPQYRPNEELIEIRHMWRPERFPLLESRIRRRQELDQLVDTIQRRTQYDFFVRLTWRFTIKE